MKARLLLAGAAAFALAGTTGALADDRPAFERDGFPITLHQVETLGSDGVQEQAPVATLTRDGMPASPHQLQVLTPRVHVTH